MLNCSRQCSGTAHRRAMSLVLLCLFLMALCLGFAAPSLAAGTAAAARQCVVQAGKAVDSADTAAFEKLVDMDGILAAALDIFVRRAKQPQAAAELPPMLAILFSQAASGEQGSATCATGIAWHSAITNASITNEKPDPGRAHGGWT